MDIVVIAILVIEIIGVTLGGVVIYRMKQQIGALKGTVETQAEGLKTLHDLNKTAVEMAKAFDPKKFAEAANTYYELVDRNANARVEEAREEARRATSRERGQAVEAILGVYQSALTMGFQLLAYVPMARRRAAIDSTDVPAEFRGLYLNLAEQAPDLSRSTLADALAPLIGIAGTGTVTQPLVPPPPPLPPDLRPPSV
jgi:predicted Holliday junction resolvase-like endonuclease